MWLSCHEQAGSRVGCGASARAASASLQADPPHTDIHALSAQRTGIVFQFLRSNAWREHASVGGLSSRHFVRPEVYTEVQPSGFLDGCTGLTAHSESIRLEYTKYLRVDSPFWRILVHSRGGVGVYSRFSHR